jgi:dTDP-4-dehydrorhamnose 3,5-epimerase
MQFTPFEIPGVVLVTPRIFTDARGFFLETYKASLFQSHGIPDEFVQDNYSYSSRNTLRGLHYQLNPHAQGKLIRCVIGTIFDVAVDIRQGSKTYGKWVSVTLNDREQNMLYIPPGFAHGFMVLSDVAHVQYKASAEYAPESERGIRWNDPAIGIQWPEDAPILSEKDKHLPLLGEAEINFVYAGSVEVA